MQSERIHHAAADVVHRHHRNKRAGGAQQRQQCRLLIKHVGNQRRKNEHTRHRAAPDQQRRREHTSGQTGEGLALRLHARQLRRRRHAQAAHDKRRKHQHRLEHAVKYAEACHRLFRRKSKEPKPRRNERRIHRLHQRGNKPHTHQRQGKRKQLSENGASRSLSPPKQRPQADGQNQQKARRFSGKSRRRGNRGNQCQRHAAQAINQPDAEYRPNHLLKQLSGGRRNWLSDAIGIAVQHAGHTEDWDARQVQQQGRHRPHIAQPCAKGFSPPESEQRKHQADGKRKRRRTPQGSHPPAFTLLRAHASDSRRKTGNDRRNEQHLCALRQLANPHRLRAQLARKPDSKQKAQRPHHKMRATEEYRLFDQRTHVFITRGRYALSEWIRPGDEEGTRGYVGLPPEPA